MLFDRADFRPVFLRDTVEIFVYLLTKADNYGKYTVSDD